VSHEPDNGGEKFVPGVAARLRTLNWAGELRELILDGAKHPSDPTYTRFKDPNEMWIANPDADTFRPLFQAALDAAKPIDAAAPEPEEKQDARPQYEVRDDGIWRFSENGPYQLINCPISIVEDVSIDDGTGEIRRRYVLTAKLPTGEAVERFSIPAEQFQSLNWIPQYLGSSAIIPAGSSIKDNLRVAIQTTSSPTRHKVYGHTGWRDVNGALVYLHQGGAVGAEGVAVELQPPLDRYHLPAVAENLIDAVKASLALLDLTPTVGPALVGGVYLAPLASYLPIDFLVWLFGGSGLFKTELAALALKHYGAGFSRTCAS
jgi:hypothetical protein